MPTATLTAPPGLNLDADAGIGRAAANWERNRSALAVRQPATAAALDAAPPEVDWATARDGSTSARDADGRWVGGCSVPLLAGRALLRSLTAEPGGQCYLAPAHAGLIVAARDRVGPDPVLFVVQPDLARCRIILGSHDWSSEIAAARLWVATGDRWWDDLRRAFDDHPGLAAPTRFIRTKLTPDAVTEPLIARAQATFGEVASARSAQLNGLAQASVAKPCGGPLVVCGSTFRLWGDAGEVLYAAAAAAGGRTAIPVGRYDLDDPLSASPLAFAAAARGCSAVLAADLGRADAAAVVPPATPWITWVTGGDVPRRDPAHPADAVVVTGPAAAAAAHRAGWPADRVLLGRWPTLALPSVTASVTGPLALIADTQPVTLPEVVGDFSSHRTLWDAIAAELHDDPLVSADPDDYLADRARQMNVDPDGLDRRAFVHGLIEPAYVQGLARLLLAGGLPVQLWGRGWAEVQDLSPQAVGPVSDRNTLNTAVAGARALIHPRPGPQWHPVQACGRPVVSPHGLSSDAFLRAARNALTAARPASTPAPVKDELGEAIASLLATDPLPS